MIRNLTIALSFIILLASCSSTKPVNTSANNKPAAPKPVAATKPVDNKKKDVKFLDEISSNPKISEELPDAKTEQKESINKTKLANNSAASGDVALKLKYAELLGKDSDDIENLPLLKSVDEWYGTKYKMGGESKSGIDCSAFVQAVYLTAFGMAVPRTAFEQYKAANRISATQMKEGDLVFFNTTGGVSHVGIYMGNNKFVHASVARGVTVSDLFDPYYLKRFLGIGRIEKSLGTR